MQGEEKKGHINQFRVRFSTEGFHNYSAGETAWQQPWKRVGSEQVCTMISVVER